MNKTLIETTTEILGKHREKKKNWIIEELMAICDI